MIGKSSPLPEELRRGLAGPIRWRLLLALIVLSAIALLHRIDALLQRDYEREVMAQAVQADALIEGTVWQRAQLLTTLAALTASAHGARDEIERFNVLASEIRRDMPDIATIYLLDSRGAVRIALGETVLPGGRVAHRAFPLRAPAMQKAAEEHAVAATAPLTLGDGRPGTLLYVPIMDGDRLTGYVAGAFAYERLFTRALAGQLRGRFSWRVLDERNDVIATSPARPVRDKALRPGCDRRNSRSFSAPASITPPEAKRPIVTVTKAAATRPFSAQRPISTTAVSAELRDDPSLTQ